MNRRVSALLALGLLAGCTPGGVTPQQSGAANVSNIITIDVSLSAFAAQQTPAGIALGFSPIVTTVAVGSGVRFVNVDNTAHTASMVAGTTFPDKSPLSFAATSPSAADALSSPLWSSGTMEPGASSQTFLVDKPGLYLYGCFYHYGGLMRGEIVAQ